MGLTLDVYINGEFFNTFVDGNKYSAANQATIGMDNFIADARCIEVSAEASFSFAARVGDTQFYDNKLGDSAVIVFR